MIAQDSPAVAESSTAHGPRVQRSVQAEGPPIRILHVIPWINSGGVERRRVQLAQRLPRSLFEQRIVCLSARKQLARSISASGVEVHTVGGTGSPGDFRTIAKVARIARQWKPHIIHGAVFEGVTLATAAGVLARVPHIIIEEIDYPRHRSWRANLLFRMLAHPARCCIAVSPPVADYLRSVKVPEQKIRVIVNGVAEPSSVPDDELTALRNSLKIPEKSIIVVSIGRVCDSHKRFSDLIQALPLVSASHPVHLVIVGGGPDLDSLRALSVELGVSTQVRFLGYQSNVGPALALGDIFALASDRESFGLVLAEAMFAGLPVVSTFGGAIPFVVENGKTGILVEVGDVPHLARSIERLARSEQLRKQMGDAGRERARRHFSAERYVSDVGDLYMEIVSNVSP